MELSSTLCGSSGKQTCTTSKKSPPQTQNLAHFSTHHESKVRCKHSEVHTPKYSKRASIKLSKYSRVHQPAQFILSCFLFICSFRESLLENLYPHIEQWCLQMLKCFFWCLRRLDWLWNFKPQQVQVHFSFKRCNSTGSRFICVSVLYD